MAVATSGPGSRFIMEMAMYREIHAVPDFSPRFEQGGESREWRPTSRSKLESAVVV